MISITFFLNDIDENKDKRLLRKNLWYSDEGTDIAHQLLQVLSLIGRTSKSKMSAQ